MAGGGRGAAKLRPRADAPGLDAASGALGLARPAGRGAGGRDRGAAAGRALVRPGRSAGRGGAGAAAQAAQSRGGNTPCSAMKHLIARYGCMFGTGELVPAGEVVTGAIGTEPGPGA